MLTTSPSNSHYPDRVRVESIDAYVAGASAREASDLGCERAGWKGGRPSHQTVINWVREAGIAIRAKRRLDHDAIFRDYLATGDTFTKLAKRHAIDRATVRRIVLEESRKLTQWEKQHAQKVPDSSESSPDC